MGFYPLVFNKSQNKYALGIDTGCVYGNKLSAAIFTDTQNKEFSIIQTSSLTDY